MRMPLFLAFVLAGIWLVHPAFAADGPASSSAQKNDAPPKRIAGPASIPVRDQASINLPADYVFIPEVSAKKLMEKMGNRVDGSLVGLIAPAKGGDWFVMVNYEATGHISDDDAKHWNADDLLSQVRNNTEAANEEREKAGVTPLEVIGWAEKPHYDEATRRLIWSISARDKGSTDDAKNIVNYKTLMLGREGLVSMTMVSPLATVGTDKTYVNLLLSDLDFTSGRKYTDFNAGTDHVAEYGLAALIAGVAVKKLGLIAVAIAFAAKFAKAIALAVVGGLAVFRRLFRRKSQTLPPMTFNQSIGGEPQP